MGSFRVVARVLASGVLTAGALAGCTAVPASPVAAPAPPPPPPPPPAACLLDAGALATGTGLTWAPDLVTATDARCVYDPSGGGAFLVVDLTPGRDLETPAALCDEGSAAPLPWGGLVCRFGPGVLGVGAVGDRVVTIAAAEVPPGTDATRLLVAFGEELDRLAAV
jgi:hypothetical protein